MRLARSILGMASIVIQTGSNSVGLPKQRQGVRLDRPRLAHALFYVARGDRAVRADVVGLVAGHLPEHRPSDLHGMFVVLGFDAPSSVVAGATLHSVERCPWHELQRFAGLLSHVLHARMARDVVGHFSERGFEVGSEQPVTPAQDEVFERVEHRLAYRPDFGIVWKQQRQLALEHQGARRHGGKNRVALARELDESRNVKRLQPLDAFEIAELELGHAAAGSFLHDEVGNLVVIENREQIVADPRLVVIHIAGRKYRHFSRRALTVTGLMAPARAGLPAKRSWTVGRQLALRVDADRLVQERARGGVAVAGVDHLRDDRARGEPAYGLGGGKQTVSQPSLALPELHRLGAQHDMRKIDVPRVRRYVRAFRHVAHVAEIALVHDLPELRVLHTVDFQRRARVDEVEERPKRREQLDAAPASVADAEYALELREHCRLVIEIQQPPRKRLPW